MITLVIAALLEREEARREPKGRFTKEKRKRSFSSDQTRVGGVRERRMLGESLLDVSGERDVEKINENNTPLFSGRT